MNYTLIRSARKTLALQLSRDGELIVRAPRNCSRVYIDAFVAEKQRWIESHRAEILAQNARAEAYMLEGETVITVCGNPFQVRLVPELRPALHRGKGLLILPDGNLSRHRQAIMNLAKNYARPRLKERLDYWAALMDVSYTGLKLHCARTRWGSCSARGTIQISVYLLFAPWDCIDYVLVHELAHRRYFDHSPAFWKLVEEMLPDFQERKRILRAFQNDPFLQRLARE